MKIAQLLSLTLLIGSTVCLIGCGKGDTPQEPEGPKTVAVVNGKCPMMGDTLNKAAVPEKMVREFNGQKVGFCCSGCPVAWDKLTDTEKQTKLDALLK